MRPPEFLLPLGAGVVEPLDNEHRKVDVAEPEQRSGLGQPAILKADLRPDAGLVHFLEPRLDRVGAGMDFVVGAVRQAPEQLVAVLGDDIAAERAEILVADHPAVEPVDPFELAAPCP